MPASAKHWVQIPVPLPPSHPTPQKREGRKEGQEKRKRVISMDWGCSSVIKRLTSMCDHQSNFQYWRKKSFLGLNAYTNLLYAQLGSVLLSHREKARRTRKIHIQELKWICSLHHHRAHSTFFLHSPFCSLLNCRPPYCDTVTLHLPQRTLFLSDRFLRIQRVCPWPLTLHYFLEQYSSVGLTLPSRGHLIVLGDIFFVMTRGKGIIVSSG
jgi:hypothetical protein